MVDLQRERSRAMLEASINVIPSCFNPFRLSFSELKCARGGHIIFLESIFQHSPHKIVIYSINRKSYNKKVNIL